MVRSVGRVSLHLVYVRVVVNRVWPARLHQCYSRRDKGVVRQGRSHRYGWSGFNRTTFSSRLRAWSFVCARMRNNNGCRYIDQWHRHRAAERARTSCKTPPPPKNPFMNIIISVRYCARRKTGPLQNWLLRPCKSKQYSVIHNFRILFVIASSSKVTTVGCMRRQ